MGLISASQLALSVGSHSLIPRYVSFDKSPGIFIKDICVQLWHWLNIGVNIHNY